MTPPADRVVVDPEGLRRVGIRMRGGAAMLSAAGRALATRPLPALPAGVETAVADAIRRANGEMQDLATELLHEAGALMERATWAELGETSSVAWLMPGLSYLPSPMPGPSPLTGGSTWGAVAQGELWPSERWAPRLLDELPPALRPLGQDPGGTEGFDDERRAQLLSSAFDHIDQTAGEGLGVVSMTAAAGLAAYEHEQAGGVGETEVGLAAAEGALTVPVPEGASGVALAGLLGCLRTGGLGGSAEVAPTDD